MDIELRFKPAPTVDAESIGLTQSVIAFVNNAPSMTPSQAAVAIPAADAKANATGPGESDETAAIDRASGFNNPIYAVDDPASTSLADPSTDPGWGQHGHHFKDSTGALKQQDALLKDIPARTRAQKDSRHIFETAAVATKGAQAGTYYGSVRWGWRTDAGGAFTKIPLAKVSDGVPSSTFMKAAELWNPATSSTGAAHVDLPIVDVKVTTGPVTLTPAGAAVAAPSIGAAVGAASGPVGPLAGPVAATSAAAPVTLPVGTRLQIINAWHPPLLSGTVKVVDGPLTGRVGEVGYAEWGLIVDERA